MSVSSSRSVIATAGEVMARARRRDAQVRRDNRLMAERVVGRAAGDGAADVSPELLICAQVGRVVGLDRACVSLVSGHDGAAPLAGSDASLVRFGDQQHSVMEGPELDAVRSRLPVVVEDLPAAAARWPFLASTGALEVVRSALSVPVGGRGSRPVGVVTVGRDRLRPFWPGEVRAVERLADLVLGLLLTRLAREDAEGVAPLQTVPFERPDRVSLAVGLLQQRHGVAPAEVLTRLRGVAFARGRTLAALAADVVAGREDPLAGAEGEGAVGGLA